MIRTIDQISARALTDDASEARESRIQEAQSGHARFRSANMMAAPAGRREMFAAVVEIGVLRRLPVTNHGAALILKSDLPPTGVSGEEAHIASCGNKRFHRV